MTDLRTPHVIEKEEKDLEIYNDYQSMMKHPGAMKSQVAVVISEKYKLRSSATLYNIRKRVESKNTFS